MMITLKQQSIKLLKKTEESMKGLVSDSINRNEYDGLEEVFPVLKLLTELINNVENDRVDNGQEIKKSVNHYVTNNNGYPVFTRIGDFLNRTGWSKKGRREYNQRILFDYVELVLPEVILLADRKSPFLMTDLIPKIKETNGDEVQNYKTYFVISWLKYLGLIKHHGDIGYSLNNSAKLIEQINQEWESLSTRIN